MTQFVLSLLGRSISMWRATDAPACNGLDCVSHVKLEIYFKCEDTAFIRVKDTNVCVSHFAPAV